VFARRATWDLHSNRLAAALAQVRRAGRCPVDLTVANPTRAGVGVPQEICWALARACPAAYAPEPLGLPAARAAVAEYYAARRILVVPEQVVLTASTSEAYGYLFRLLADPGDNILVPCPSYPLFDYLAGLEGLDTRKYPLRCARGRWEVDVDRLAAAIDARTRAVVLVSPNNPTGSYLGAADRQAIEQLARECDLALVADEVFGDFALEAETPSPESFAGPGATVLTFALSGLSKVLAAPQLKLSWIVVGGPAAWRDEALARMEVIADTYLSVGTHVQLALPALLHLRASAQASVRRRLEENLRLLRQSCGANAPFEALPVEGGWYAVLRADGDDEQLALSLLTEADVLVHPGYLFDFPTGGHLVLSLLAADFGAGLQRLADHLGR
jgi:alanine-synthesizing transaminase